MVHCFFEQSGTFKREFLRLGIPAEDYDIQNNFGETDHVCDLFAEINAAYDGGASIFDGIKKDDLIMAFFPCIYFCENNALFFTGKHRNNGSMSRDDMLQYILERSKSRQRFYELLIEFFAVCERKGVRMILENPYSAEHYLVNNFPYAPAIIDHNRRLRGDYFVKPTQYYFVNCTPTCGMSYENNKVRKTVQRSKPGANKGICSEERSMIAPEYARNFICDFILGKEQAHTMRTLF